MSSKFTYTPDSYKDQPFTMVDRMPYCYLIGWSHLDTWYYGAKYAKKCHPSTFWKDYFTSSKHVKKFRELHGEPDVIQIRRIFNSVRECCIWEDIILSRMKVKYSSRWLNLYDGYKGNPGSMFITVKNNLGTVFVVKRDDPKFLSGEYVHHLKGENYHITDEHRKYTAEVTNKDRNKIEKMAEKHRGMKRGIRARDNMSVARRRFIDNGGEVANKGTYSFYDPETLERRDFIPGTEPADWIRGNPKNKGKKCYWDGINNKIMKRFFPGDEPQGWIQGNPLNPNKRL